MKSRRKNFRNFSSAKSILVVIGDATGQHADPADHLPTSQLPAFVWLGVQDEYVPAEQFTYPTKLRSHLNPLPTNWKNIEAALVAEVLTKHIPSSAGRTHDMPGLPSIVDDEGDGEAAAACDVDASCYYFDLAGCMPSTW